MASKRSCRRAITAARQDHAILGVSEAVLMAIVEIIAIKVMLQGRRY